MERLTPVLVRAVETQVLALCEDHLRSEESLLTAMLHSLRQVRDAFFQRNLQILPTLQSRQEQLTQEATAMAAVRARLRAALADLLGVSAEKATLRAAALSLPEPGRSHLLERHAHLSELLRQSEKLSQQNAALLGYARGFFACLFAGRNGTSISERYGPQGERHTEIFGPLLEARV